MPVALNTVQVLSLFIGTLLPLLVGLVTKQSTHPAIKSVLLLALSTLAGFLTEWQHAATANVGYNWKAGALTAVITFVIAATLHSSLWKKIGAADLVQNTLIKDEPKIDAVVEGAFHLPPGPAAAQDVNSE